MGKNKEVAKWFSSYKRKGWSLVPLIMNDKRPFEIAWTSKEHKDHKEWVDWFNGKMYNFGVRTGEVSNITVIDIDTLAIPPELEKFWPELSTTLMSKTNKGTHHVFQYEKDLPSTNCRYGKLKLDVDIKNDGGQVVIFPSIVDNVKRVWSNENPIQKMSDEFKAFLLEQTIKTNGNSNLQKLDSVIDIEGVLPEGSRNNFLTSLGGILRKQLTIAQTRFVLNLLNRKLCESPLSQQEIDAMLRSLESYQYSEEMDLGNVILEHLRVAEEASERDLKELRGLREEPKEKITKALRYLQDNNLIFKRRNLYHISKKADWQEEFGEDGKELSFKVPYWNDYAVFRMSDMCILGGGSGFGKTTISVNILKQFVKQGIKPYYISLESGSRFANHARRLGLREGDFYWCHHQNPESIELEDNAVTIIDWLLPKDYATVDKLFAHFNDQLAKHSGFLIVMMQLRKDGSFFAENLVEFFPSFVCKFGFEDEVDRTYSYFETIKIRESKTRMQKVKIPCKYNFETRELELISEEDDLNGS